MYNAIKSQKDMQYFYEKTNSLHDGRIIGIRYVNDGITKTEYGHYFDFERTKLILEILVTSIWNAVVELEFDGIYEWQIKENGWDMTDTTVMFDDHNRIVWLDDTYSNMEEAKKGCYVIAKSMKWRIAE